MMQTQIPRGLSALMSLEPALNAIQQGMQLGDVIPTTPQGTPTVAAQMVGAAEQAISPAVNQIAQQAGLGGQIQAMQQQQAQQALMQQAMAQRPPAGIEGLNPNIQGFNEGGIVGYARGDQAKDKEPPKDDEEGLLKYFLGIPASIGALAGGQQLATAVKNASELASLARYGSLGPGAAEAAAGAAEAGALGRLAGPIGIGGLALSGLSTQMLAGRPELRSAYIGENAPSILAADPSGMALAAAILEEGGKTAQAARAAQEPKRREAPALETLPQASYSLEGKKYPQTLYALERFPNIRPGDGGRGGAGPGAPTGGAPTGMGGGIVTNLMKKEREELAKMQTAPPSAEEIAAQQAKDDPVYRQFLISKGIDPDALIKRVEEDKALFEQQRGLIRERMERERGKDTFLGRMGEALRGFSQMKGQGLGRALLGSEEALARRVAAGELRMDQLKDIELKVNELEITRRRALEDARRATAEGDWNRAAQSLATERQAKNEQIKLTSGTFGKEAQLRVEEEKIFGGREERALQRRALDENRLRTQIARYDSEIAENQLKVNNSFAKNPIAMLYSMNPAQALKDNPEGVRQYLDEKAKLERDLIEPLKKQRAELYQQLAGGANWGTLKVDGKPTK